MELLRLEQVFKIYKEGDVEAVALRGANLSVESGSSLSIVGRSGAGKSTLLHLIGGLMVPSAGKILIDGQDIGRLNEAERSEFRRQNVGIVYQDNNLIAFLTALENVELPLRLEGKTQVRRRAKELLGALGLENRLHHKGAFLSGGERQRVAIAVALANNPRLLLADELTGELDSRTADAVMTSLTEFCSDLGNTLIVVTHNPSVAKRTQRQVRLHDGLFIDDQENAREVHYA